MLKRWTADLARKTAEDDEIMLLEIQARLRRLARDCVTDGNTHTPLAADGDTVARIAAYLGDHYREPFSSEALGHAVGLHPRSAMRLFHRACGTTLVEHLTFHRIAHAQRLLATTDAKVIDVASESGFPSLSRFYAAFRSVCGQTPKAFRQQVWQPRSR